MARSKEGKDREFYLSQIRELTKENRALKKQIRVLEKREHLVEDTEPVVEEIHINDSSRIYCLSDSYGKGTYDTMELMDKIFGTCNVCGDRRRLK